MQDGFTKNLRGQLLKYYLYFPSHFSKIMLLSSCVSILASYSQFLFCMTNIIILKRLQLIPGVCIYLMMLTQLMSYLGFKLNALFVQKCLSTRVSTRSDCTW